MIRFVGFWFGFSIFLLTPNKQGISQILVSLSFSPNVKIGVVYSTKTRNYQTHIT